MMLQNGVSSDKYPNDLRLSFLFSWVSVITSPVSRGLVVCEPTLSKEMETPTRKKMRKLKIIRY